MPSFFEGFLLVLMIFGFCVGIAIIIKIGVLWIEENNTTTPPPQQESKIYLVKQTSSAPKPKPQTRKRRSPKIAFEGLVLKPENVLLEQEDEQEKDNQKQSKISF